MPKIPQLRTNIGRAPATASGQGFFANANTFAKESTFTQDAVGNSLGNLGNALLKEQAKKKERQDRLSALDALNSANREMNEFNTQTLSKKGKNALNVLDETEDKSEEIRNRYSDGLVSDYSKGLFKSSYDSKTVRNLERAGSHQVKETNDFELASLNDESGNAVVEAVINYQSKETLDASELTVTANAGSIAAANGGDAETIQLARNEAGYNLYKQVMDSRRKDSPTNALNFLRDNKDKFNPLTVEATEDKLENDQKSEIADTVLRRNSTAPLKVQLAIASDIKDPETRNLVTKTFKQMSVANTERQKIIDQEIVGAEVDKIERNPFSYKLDYKRLSKDQQDDIISYYMRKMSLVRGDRNKVGAPSDPTTLDRLHRLSLDQLRNENLLKLRTEGKIDEGDHKIFLTKIRDDSGANRDSNKLIDEIMASPEFKRLSPTERNRARVTYKNKIDALPPDQKDNIDAINKISKEINEAFITSKSFNLFGFSFNDKPSLEVSATGEETEGPRIRPKHVPAQATWGTTRINGKNIKGWTWDTSKGTYIFDRVNNKIYKRKTKGSK